MSFFSWLFGSNKKEQTAKQTISKPSPRKKRGEYGFDEKRVYHSNELEKFKRSSLKIKKVKIIVDKNDLDACSTIKSMKKIYSLNDAPLIPLNKDKCLNCTCYYEPKIRETY